MDQRNLILAIVLSLAILLTFQFFVVEPQKVTPGDPNGQVAEQMTPSPQAGTPAAPTPPGAAGIAASGEPGAMSRDEALVTSARVRIETPTLTGSIALTGGRIDDLILSEYRETIEPDSPNIVLLSPSASEAPYFADFGWSSVAPGMVLPNADTVWKTNSTVLTPDRPVTLSWDNGAGLRFERTYAIDEHYMFTVSQRVVNSSDKAVSLAPYGLISRTGTPPILGFYILHEGLIGVFDDVLQEIDYSDLKDDKRIEQQTTGGWIGITDKYWMVALVPDQDKTVDTRFLYDAASGVDKYQTDFLYEAMSVPSGGSAETTSRLFAGAKNVTGLDDYRDRLGIARFDLSVDFGWFYWLTKPLFYALHYIAEKVGNFGVAILILTVGVKLVFFPLANKSYTSMAKMRRLQPQMIELRERYKEDKQRLNQEMAALYKKEGANPISGCLPIVIQIPVFFALYKVMFVTIEMRQAPFFGWIQDLSAPDPTSIINVFGLLPFVVPNLGPLDIINIGVWPLLMGLTMFLQQQLNPQPPDPIQAKIFLFMPIIFTFLLARFPAGLVIYWTWNNILSM
ncbi:MAG: membrane protein insertase YidC, partial [Alphaproteobacteria bacterium]|nr:membrane protein insertase YidC [Alphaproteobacteria bacterium]